MYRSKASFNLLELRPKKSRREERKVFLSLFFYGRILSRGNASSHPFSLCPVCQKLLLQNSTETTEKLSFVHLLIPCNRELDSGILFPIQTDRSFNPHFISPIYCALRTSSCFYSGTYLKVCWVLNPPLSSRKESFCFQAQGSHFKWTVSRELRFEKV